MHAAETRPHPSASPRPEQAVFVIRSRFPWRQLAPHACDPPLDGIIAATEAVSFEWAGLLCIPRQQSRILPFCSSFLRGSTFPLASSLHSAVRSPDTPGGGVPSGSLASITQRSVPLPPPHAVRLHYLTQMFSVPPSVFSLLLLLGKSDLSVTCPPAMQVLASIRARLPEPPCHTQRP